MLLYYITDRKQFPGTEAEQQRALLERIGEAAATGVNYIQLREKDLQTRELEIMARAAVDRVRQASSKTKLLINSRLDVAIATGADGVHLTGTDISASDARAIRAAHERACAPNATSRDFMVAVSCHSASEVRSAESHGADFVVLAPIFEKPGTDVPALGLQALQRAALSNVPPDLRVEAGDHRIGIPVLALGGVNQENAAECLRAGAAGLAGIRLFQQGELRRIMESLKRRY